MAHNIPFRNRGHEVSRLEAFSDVIFGFAISLLVVSLEAPKTYPELLEMMNGFLPFGFCFLIFIDIWFEHHAFFKRYALQDTGIIVINTVLLFVVLFYVYPLKYMFSIVGDQLRGHAVHLPPHALPTLFTIYGLGFTAVFWSLMALYCYAWSKREDLGLNLVERIDTQESIWDNFFMGVFGLLSTAMAHTRLVPIAGSVYFLIAIPKTLVPTIMGRRRRRAESAMLAAEQKNELPN